MSTGRTMPRSCGTALSTLLYNWFGMDAFTRWPLPLLLEIVWGRPGRNNGCACGWYCHSRSGSAVWRNGFPVESQVSVSKVESRIRRFLWSLLSTRSCHKVHSYVHADIRWVHKECIYPQRSVQCSAVEWKSDQGPPSNQWQFDLVGFSIHARPVGAKVESIRLLQRQQCLHARQHRERELRKVQQSETTVSREPKILQPKILRFCLQSPNVLA